MKKLFFIAALAFGCLSIKIADAQITFRAGVNIGSQPEWGPVGYAHAQYYYMPDIDCYYDVQAHMYVYDENGRWIHAGSLPGRFHFDRYNTYKVVVNQPNPWEHHADVRTRYSSYRGRQGQAVIRDSHDSRYQNHWRGDQDGGDRGHGGDHGRGHDHGDH